MTNRIAKPVAPVSPVAKAPVRKPVVKKPVSVNLAPAAPATPVAKEKPMTDTIKTMTDKTQSMMADANDRAKGAMEKGTKAFEEFSAFQKGNIEAMVESSKIAAKGFETMGQEAAAYAKKSYEEATAALKSLSAVKSPTDFFKLQSDYARSSFDAMIAQGSKSTEKMVKLAGEVAQPIQNRLALAAEKVKIAA